MPILLLIVLTVSACSPGSSAASARSRQFFINVGSNNASYFTWIEAPDGSITGSAVAAARDPDGTTHVPSPTAFTGKVVGHDITFDLGASVQGEGAGLSGKLGPRTLTIRFPPSRGSCKTNPVVVFKAGTSAEFTRDVKVLSTTATCLPS